jgi:N-acetylglucosamine kinase-like BadF-type ATPase
MSRMFDLCVIDAGQTNVRYLVYSQGKRLLYGETGAGVTNIMLPGAQGVLLKNLKQILYRVRSSLGGARFRVVSMGCTGVSREREEYRIVRSVLRTVFARATVLLESDIVTSHEAVFQGRPGVIVHAGTGAFAYGVDGSGNRQRTGGWGYLLGDEGAGFGIGLSGIRASLCALEKTGPYTSLEQALLPFFGINSHEQLKSIVYSGNFQRRQFAEFARFVLEHGASGDRIARQIVAGGIEQMVRLVDPILKTLVFECAEVALTGGLFVKSSSYYEQMKAALERVYAERVQVRRAEESPLEGALRFGLQAIRGSGAS